MAIHGRRTGIRGRGLALLLGLAACNGSLEPASPTRSADPPPRVLGSSGPALSVSPGGTPALARGPAVAPLAESEGPTAFALHRVADDGETTLPVPGAGRTLAATTLAGGILVRVTDRGGLGDLVLEDARETDRTLDTDVLPELAVSPDGRRLLYARRAAGGHELVLAEPSRGLRTVVYRGPTADRPVFRDDGTAWAFFGTADTGFVAPFVGAPGVPARPLANVGRTRTGNGLPPGFVPPPAERESLRFPARDDAAPEGTVRWRAPDGRRCRVDVATARAACEEDGG